MGTQAGNFAEESRRACRTRQLLAACSRLLAVLAIAAACSSGSGSPEARVRTALADAERAAEEKDLRTLKAALSLAYSDSNGNDRDAIAGLLTYHFLRNRDIHLLTRVAGVALDGNTRSAVTVFVAMAGRPIPNAVALAQLRASLYRFEFDLAEENDGSWRVTGAEWRPAVAADFL